MAFSSLFSLKKTLKAVSAICLMTQMMGYAFAFETPARAAILMDSETGTVLYEKDARTPIPPASMSKLMTAYLVFDALKSGQITMDTELYVSGNARSQIGSRMFINEGDKVKVSDLIRGVIVQSGNDACIVFAEGLSGTVASFAELMNKKAQELGLKESYFVNPTGLPDPKHLMSVHDLAELSRRIIMDFPEYYKIYSELSFTWNNIKQGNRNPLLYGYDGADGVKTGHTEEAGYGLVGSAKRGNMRLISVVSGLKQQKDRGTESRNLLDYGFGRYVMRQVGAKNFKVIDLPVYLGETDTVPVVLNSMSRFPIERGAVKNVTTKLTYNAPLIAPIKAGDKIGTLHISGTGKDDMILPVYAKQDVGSASLWKNLKTSVNYFLFGEELPEVKTDTDTAKNTAT